jgi:hypothetical protein
MRMGGEIGGLAPGGAKWNGTMSQRGESLFGVSRTIGSTAITFNANETP